MTSAQASVGAAATSPTTGTILMAADAMRQGAATTPQPEANMHSIETRIHFIGRARKKLIKARPGYGLAVSHGVDVGHVQTQICF